MTPTYNGVPIFGSAVRIAMIPNANAAQVAAFFGVQGVQSLDGGGRGRVFEVEGVFVGANSFLVEAQAASLSSYADGVARILVDTVGGVWPNVVYRNEFSWAYPKYLDIVSRGLKCRPYKLVLNGLT